MAAKLPGFDASVGTAEHPAPNSPPAAIAEPDGTIEGAIDGAAADGAAAGAAAVLAPPPQADRETAQIEAAVTTANFKVRM
jgi:hypothetical protein